jgi:hypothetical protein
MSHKHRIQNPHLATTGSPETPAMCCNACDELGKRTMTVFRSQVGQLYIMGGDSVSVRLPEDVFDKTLNFWYEKYKKNISLNKIN